MSSSQNPAMPREPIDIPGKIEHLSILDEDGKLDEEIQTGSDARMKHFELVSNLSCRE